MTGASDVEILREAAARMRELAEAATPGPWESWSGASAGGGEYVTSQSAGYTFGVTAGLTGRFDLAAKDAAHIAAWHPMVALLVAETLEQHAEEHDTYDCRWEAGWCAATKAARAFLGITP